jgi:hypothetical protein
MFKKISLFLAMIVFSSLFFVSCEEDTLTSGDAEITSLSNVIALPGGEVTINGSNFGDTKLATYKVMVGTTEVTATNTTWADDKIIIKVPGTITPSNTATYIQVVSATTSNQVTFYVGDPNPVAPTAIKATSITDSIVHLTWTPSEDEGKAIFAGYELIMSEQGGAPLAPVAIAKNATPYEIKGLTQGTVYTFEIRGIYNAEAKNAVSIAAASISWSPASRFDETANEVPIRVYGTQSQFGSGLSLFDETEGAPTIFKIASSPDWQFCLYTTDGALEFGSAAAQTKYTYNAGAPRETQIADVDIFANSLNDAFLGATLNSFNFTSKVVNLNDAKYSGQDKGVVLVVRVNSTTGYNYAKVLVKKVANKFLQGTGDDSYLECVVSYQKVKGVPYARF